MAFKAAPDTEKDNGDMSGLGAEMDAIAGGGSLSGLGAALAKMDLSAIPEGGGYVVIKERTECDLRIVGSDSFKAKSGNTCIKLTLEVVAPEQYKGAKCWDNLTLIPNSLWKFKSLAKATDMLSEDGQTFTGDSEKAFKGHMVTAFLIPGEWEGKPKNEVDGGYAKCGTDYGAMANATEDMPRF